MINDPSLIYSVYRRIFLSRVFCLFPSYSARNGRSLLSSCRDYFCVLFFLSFTSNFLFLLVWVERWFWFWFTFFCIWFNVFCSYVFRLPNLLFLHATCDCVRLRSLFPNFFCIFPLLKSDTKTNTSNAYRKKKKNGRVLWFCWYFSHFRMNQLN